VFRFYNFLEEEQSFATGGTGIPACHITGKMPVPPKYNFLDNKKRKTTEAQRHGKLENRKARKPESQKTGEEQINHEFHE